MKPEDPNGGSHLHAIWAAARLMMTVFPVSAIRGNPDRVVRAQAWLDTHLTDGEYVRVASPSGFEQVMIYQRGGRRRRAAAVLANIFTSGGGDNFNISYHVLVERTAPGELLFSVHGIDRSFRARFNPEETFGALFEALRRAESGLTITAWFDGATLSPDLASSHAGFVRTLGRKRSFWWA